MKNNFFERRGDTRSFPLVGDQINPTRLWLLFIYPIILMVSVILISEHISNAGSWSSFFILSLIPTGLFLGGYRLITGQTPWHLFRHVTFREWLYAALLLIFQYIYATIAQRILLLVGTKSVNNPNFTALGGAHKWALFLNSSFNSLFQLMNEEFLGIFIFLAMTAILIQQFKLTRNAAIWGSLIVSLFVFGMVHFAVYNWNIPQMLLIIGVERIIMTGAYIHSKSIWTSFAMHYLFDTSGFLLATLTSAFMLYLH